MERADQRSFTSSSMDQLGELPKMEPFATTLSAQFSLPAKTTKTMDLPMLRSSTRSPHRYKEDTSNVHMPDAFSRFTSQTRPSPGDLRSNPEKSSNQKLSHESSGAEEPLYSTRSTGNENRQESNQNTASEGSPSSEFHFSIHKWVGRGVPLLMSLRGGTHPTFRGDSRVYTVQDADFPHANVLAYREYIQPHSKVSLSDGTDKEISTEKQEVSEHVVSLRSLLGYEIEEQGDIEVDKETEGKEKMEKMTDVSNSNVGSYNKAEVNKSAIGSHKSSGEKLGKVRVKRKVKEFFKILDQENPLKPKINAITSSLRSKWKFTGKNVSDSEVSDSVAGEDIDVLAADGKIVPYVSSTTELNSEVTAENVKMEPDASSTIALNGRLSVDNGKRMSYSSFVVDENVVRYNKKKFSQDFTVTEITNACFTQTNASSLSESGPYDSKVNVEYIDELSLDNILVQELSPDDDKLSKTGEESEAITALDSKIHLWSDGRKGNIRSLLSTLQFVLWSECGWKPVALVDLIDPNAVKKAYNRAMLCLHPDKLQQKGITSDKKYVAEKVFDILQEAWDHFNLLG